MGKQGKSDKDKELTMLRAQAEPFLRALFGDFCARGLQGFIETRIIGPKGVQSPFFPTIEKVTDALPGLQVTNEAGRNIYIGVNPRSRERGREEDVQHVVALHADLDHQDPVAAVELAERAGVNPSIAVASGGGAQLYWKLRDPLEIHDEGVRARVRGINAAIAAALGGDHCHDLNRILRLPGFRNQKEKYPDHPVVNLLFAYPQRCYTLDEFNFLHPARIPSVKASSATIPSGNSPELSPRVKKLIEEHDLLKLRWAGDPLGLADSSRSAIDFSIAAVLKKAGCDLREFSAAVHLAPYNKDRQHDLTAPYIQRTFERACGDEPHAPAPTPSPLPAKASATTPAITVEQARAMLPEVLDEIAGMVRTYIVLSDAQRDIVSVWIVHTHAIDAADLTPYLHIVSPEKRSGKTLLLELFSLLTWKAWFTSNATAAAVARKIAGGLTAMIDEADTFLLGEGERQDMLRGVLNAGYSRSGRFSRCVGQGAALHVEDLNVFGPKAIAGLRELPDTIADRSIPISLKRALPTELRQRFRRREVEPLALALREKIAPIVAALVPTLRDTRPDRIPDLNDRQADIVEPLLAITQVAGGDWPRRARAALLSILVREEDEQSVGVSLLKDIRTIFNNARLEKLETAGILKALCELPESRWSEFNRGKPLNSHRLARILRSFDIKPRMWREGSSVCRGYEAADFHDGWARYLAPSDSGDGPRTATPLQPLNSEPSENKACSGVAVQPPVPEQRDPKEQR